MKLLLAGIGLAMAVAFNAHAQDGCFSPSMAEKLAKDKGWQIVEFKDLLKDDAGHKAEEKHLKDVLAGDGDGADVPDFDTLIAVDADGPPTAFAAIFKDGCVVKQGNIPKQAFKGLQIFAEGT